VTIQTATIESGGLKGYLARPEGTADGGMLLLPMITGIGAQLRVYADSIAAQGVVALAWDPFHGPSSDDTSLDALIALAPTITDPAAQREQRQWVDYMIGDLKLPRVGVIGWCMGGRMALVLAARDQRLVNCVAYHPTIRRPLPPHQTEDAIELAPAIGCPVQVLYPGGDHIVTRETFDALERALQTRTAPTIAHVYPGAEHGFMDAARQANPINRASTALAWPQTLAFISATLELNDQITR
jgi:carboxymethylenebutenolidase